MISSTSHRKQGKARKGQSELHQIILNSNIQSPIGMVSASTKQSDDNNEYYL